MKDKYFFIQFNFCSRFIFFSKYFILFILTITVSGCLSYVSKTNDEMVLVPEGLFIMGYKIDNTEEWGDTDEEPVHEIFLKSYYIDR